MFKKTKMSFTVEELRENEELREEFSAQLVLNDWEYFWWKLGKVIKNLFKELGA